MWPHARQCLAGLRLDFVVYPDVQHCGTRHGQILRYRNLRISIEIRPSSLKGAGLMLGVGAEVLSTQPKMPTLTAAEKREPNTAGNAGFRASGRRPSPEEKEKKPVSLSENGVCHMQRETLC
jgi:hypothetical protein